MWLMLLACFISDKDVSLGLDPDVDGFGVSEDCAPIDATVYPGAEEICGDGVVNNCEMPEEEARAMCRLQGELSLADADLKIVAENPGEYVAESIAGGGDVDGDGLSDLLMGAPRNTSGGYEAGAAYLLLSSGALRRQELPLNLSAADLKHTGTQEWSDAGWSVAILGDVNGDHRADWAVGEQHYTGVADASGAVFVYSSAEGGDVAGQGGSQTTLKWTGEAMTDRFGSTVAAAGDVNGDGLADLIVGAYTHDGGAVDSGAAYLLLSNSALTARDASSDVIVADCKLVGVAAYDNAGIELASAGDVDGDGLADLLVGAAGQDSGGQDAGAVYLLRSSQTLNPECGVMSLADADLMIVGEAAGDVVGGRSVAGGGDVDQDGYGDVLVGAYGHNSDSTDQGAAYLLLSSGALRTGGSTLNLGAADVKMIGENENDYAGSAVAFAGDVDGDWRPDVLVGAIREDGAAENAGAAYLLFNAGALFSGGAVMSLSDADLKLTGEAYWDHAGNAVTGPGDVNGDGLGDVFVGTHHVGVGGVDDPDGAAYVILGRSF